MFIVDMYHANVRILNSFDNCESWIAFHDIKDLETRITGPFIKVIGNELLDMRTRDELQSQQSQ